MDSIVEKIIAVILLTILSPFLTVLYILVKSTSKGPFVFKQKRAGKNKKPFIMYKIRTMEDNAEALKKQYLDRNEVDGPVFKIRNDPRYTKIGRFLSHTGLDEILQLVNIIKGEMSFVGPRPLPVREAAQVADRYNSRFSILPGITSPWIIKGSHQLKFKEWMELDLAYVKQKSTFRDFMILTKTIVLIHQFILDKLSSSHRKIIKLICIPVILFLLFIYIFFKSKDNPNKLF